jgi:hypothetical protein
MWPRLRREVHGDGRECLHRGAQARKERNEPFERGTV